jgi:hypothetical protein
MEKNGNEGIEMTNENEKRKINAKPDEFGHYGWITESIGQCGYCGKKGGKGIFYSGNDQDFCFCFDCAELEGHEEEASPSSVLSLTPSQITELPEKQFNAACKTIRKTISATKKAMGVSPSSAKDEDMIISPRGARQIKARQDACQHDFVSDGNRNGSVMYERCEKCGITKGAV